MLIFITLLAALIIDHLYGEARRFHPLIYFGKFATKLEQKLNVGSNLQRFCYGTLAWCLLVLPIPVLYLWLSTLVPLFVVILVNIYVVYWAVALNSLNAHGIQIYQPLLSGDLAQARFYCSYIVSRDTSELDQQAISRATTESMLENGHDAVMATLIYFVLGGAPLVIAHRLSNTLDAMWGYRNQGYNYFGKFSARMDDLLGFISALITGLLFALIGLAKGRAVETIKNACLQSQTYKSFNGGWVMAAGATVLNVSLGGPANYFGKLFTSPKLGQGDSVQAHHIKASLSLVKQAVILWLFIVLLSQLVLF